MTDFEKIDNFMGSNRLKIAWKIASVAVNGETMEPESLLGKIRMFLYLVFQSNATWDAFREDMGNAMKGQAIQSNGGDNDG